MKKTSKTGLKEIIAQSNIQTAIDVLLKKISALIKGTDEKEIQGFYDELILFSARLNSINQEIKLGIIEDNYANNEKNRIINGVLQLINSLPDEIFATHNQQNLEDESTKDWKIGLENNSSNFRSNSNFFDINGVWKCQDLNNSIVTTMEITKVGDQIKVIGIGQHWIGEGVFDGNEGFYDWQFNDGRVGRTYIHFDAEENLIGNVKGQISPWTYIATR